MNWSTKAWQEIGPIYQKIIEMPFIEELMKGSLPLEKFQFYMVQDAHYLDQFGRALAIIAARTHDLEDSLAFIKFAEGAVVVEKALHESYFEGYGLKERGSIQPTCHHYGHFLKSTAALQPVEVAIAAVLPCFWIYKEVGDHIYSNQVSDNNPYQKWIDTYAGEEFGLITQRAVAISDRIALGCTPKQRQAMTEAFITASRLEYEFWHSAYTLRRW
ncbi:thiaminase II [Pseudozobellia thermophila]|uniref:Aminopyrimidine aminohydrolase n=1 Tax=Pseudozobellia thermophila TaxID=192903 RepID=A0A1M6FSS7_9FLAO|nr:thiaminase II [Pseudozobellia thermophila]SHJ00732.1 thiaminase /4-amino-5-aminomethyl-2-methylpyrimidine deaminase [Pseudozobellia thermophila]